MKLKKPRNEIDMINGPLLPKILLFSATVFLTNLMQLLFNTADLVVVGRFAGNEALGAVGATGALTTLLVNLFIGFSV
ncbi:MAG: oligosaccharide flippase family protein, partial [Candidatus Avispirillum sp.]